MSKPEALPSDMAPVDPLTLLASAFTYAGLPAQLREISAELPVRQLLIGPSAYQDRPGHYDPERLLFVSVIPFNELQRGRGQPINPYSDALQFVIHLPFQVPPALFTPVYQAMAALNPLLPYGGLTLDAQGQPYFRYTWKFRSPEEVEAHVLLEVFNASLFFVERLGWRLEAIATGAQTLEAVLAAEIDFRP